MGTSKIWNALTPEQKKAKRKEYNDRYKAKNPEKLKESIRLYKEKNKVSIRKKASKWQKEKGRLNKIKAIEYKGGVCLDCNTVYPPCCYDFHHLDPLIKDSTIAQIMGRDFNNIIPELEKCVLLCANCHRIRHFNER